MKDKPPKTALINARAETLSDKPSFRNAFIRKRCLIPADGYYEWARRDGEKIPHYIYRPSKKIMGFAGLWESYRDAHGNRHSSCTIVTREARGPLRDIHIRMPVVLDNEGRQDWLDTSITDKRHLADVLNGHAVTNLSFHRVSDTVNRASFNSPECIRAL